MLKNEDFIQEFVEEARDHLENFERILLHDLAAISAEQINDAFRAIHSIKGTAGFFGLARIVAVAHAMETILDFVNRKKVAVSDAEIDLLLEARDRLSVLVNDVKHSDSYPIEDILARSLPRLILRIRRAIKRRRWRSNCPSIAASFSQFLILIRRSRQRSPHLKKPAIIFMASKWR